LSGGDVTVGVDDADALAEIEVLKAELDELEAKRATISARADTVEARADLDELKAKADELDGKTVTIHAKADTSEAESGLNGLMAAAVGLAPAIIPIAAAAAGGLGAIGIGALGAVAGIGVLKEAFSGVGTAISAVQTAQTQQGQNAASAAAQQISSANSVANAQDSLRTAVENVAVAQETAARNVASAMEQQQNAVQAVAVAEETAARNIASAIEQQKQAEQSLTDAIRSQTQAQQALTQARIDAQNALINSTLSVQDNALAQRSAQLQLEQAQQNLAQLSPSATALQRQQAQLAVDQAQQQITDTIAQGQQLQQQNTTLQKQGVGGSQQVVAAQNSITSANEQVASSQQRVGDTTAAVAQAQEDAARNVAGAQQKLADATKAVAQAQEDGARQIAQSQQAVVTATRALQDAQASQAAQAASAANANNAVAAAMAKLSPAGQSFVNFIVGLKPQLDQLKQSASDGVLTGLQAGIQAVLPDLPLLNSLIATISGALGDLAKDAGQALASPYWTGFISFIQGEAAPSIQTFGVIIGNLAHGFAGLLEAFKPVWDQMGAGLEHLTADFANFGATASSNTGFQNFLAYVEKEGPVVVQTLGNLILAFAHIGEALGPLGGVVLTVVNDLAKFVAAIPTPILTPLVTALYLGYLGWKSWQIVDNITTSIGKFVEGVQTLLTKLGILNDTTATATVAVETQTVATEELTTVQGVQAIDLDALTVSETAKTVAEGADTAATEGLTVATGALDVAMDANPIGLVITALGALILVVVEVWDHFDTLKAVVGDVWGFLGSVIQGTYNDVIKPVFDFFVGIIDGLVGAFQTAINNIGSIWGLLGNIVKAPVNFVIDPIYDKGIAGLWNDIAGVFGLPTLPIIATLAGGGVLSGYAPGRDTVPALLSPGEGVLVPEAVAGLGPDFVLWANEFYSGGRSTPSSPGRFATGGIVGDIAGLFTDPAGTIANIFAPTTSQTNQIPGTGELHQALVDIPGKVVSAAVDKAKSYVSSLASAVTGSIGGGVEQWRPVGLAALTAEGQDAAANISYLLAQMTTESGGNPTIVNTTDSNWVAGTPSVGLLQVIGPTYATYKDPRFDKGPYEYGVSVDPMANITAAIKYTLSAYGSLSSVWGQGHGYDNGGWLPPGLTMAYNNTRTPEAVLTGSQWSTLMNRTQGGDSGRPITVNVYPRADHSEAEIADMVSRQLSISMRTHR